MGQILLRSTRVKCFPKLPSESRVFELNGLGTVRRRVKLNQHSYKYRGVFLGELYRVDISVNPKQN